MKCVVALYSWYATCKIWQYSKLIYLSYYPYNKPKCLPHLRAVLYKII